MHALDAQQINLKVYLREDSEIDPEAVIPVFHRWISERVLDETVIDVADYRHLTHGPALLLAGLDANYTLDNTDGVYGLIYARKRGGPNAFAERLSDALKRVLSACALLEKDSTLPAPPRFRVDSISLRINNRLLAPNTVETYAAVVPDVDEMMAKLFPDATVNIHYQESPQQLFGVLIQVEDGPEETVDSLLARIQALTTPSRQ